MTPEGRELYDEQVLTVGLAILTRVAEFTGVPVKDMIGHNRCTRPVLARALYPLAMRCHGYSWPDVGLPINRYHTTVMRECNHTRPEAIRRTFGEYDIKALAAAPSGAPPVPPETAHERRQAALADFKAWEEFCREEYPFSWQDAAATPPRGAAWVRA